jgi:hypothetical protein
MIEAFSSQIDLDKVNQIERLQILKFCEIIYNTTFHWSVPTIECKKLLQSATLQVRAFGGNGRKTATEYIRAHDLARDMADRYSITLIDKIPFSILNQPKENTELEEYPEELQQAYDTMIAKENAILDREYYYRIYDYMDHINGIIIDGGSK